MGTLKDASLLSDSDRAGTYHSTNVEVGLCDTYPLVRVLRVLAYPFASLHTG